MIDFFRNIVARVTREPQPDAGSRVVYGRTKAGVFVDQDEALRNSVVWACVRYLTGAIGALPWRVYREVIRGQNAMEKRQMPSHPVAVVLSDRPCPWHGAFTWREAMLSTALLRGNAFAEIDWAGNGTVAALYPIHPDRVRTLVNDAGTEVRYEVTGNGDFRAVEPWNMFHLRGFGTGILGMDVVSFAAESIGWARATEVFGSSYFGNGISPSGIVKTKGRLSKDGLQNLKNEFDGLYKGSGNAQKTVFLDGDMDWQRIGTDPNTAQFIETRQHQVEEICRWFGVPPHKVMHLLRATFSNIEHQSIEVVTDAVLPWVKRFEEEADFKLFGGNRKGYYTKLDLKGLLRGDFSSRANGYKVLRELGVLSVNEIRELEDMNPIGAEGDKRIAPMNFTTLQKIGEDAPAPAPVAKPAPADAEDAADSPDAEDATDIAESNVLRKRLKNMTLNITVNPAPITVQLPEAPAPIVQNVVNVPEQAAPIVQNTVNVPEQNITFEATLPEVKAPDVVVNVPQAAAPMVTVNVPDQKAPIVNVHVPDDPREQVFKRDHAGDIVGIISRRIKEKH